MDAGTKGVGPHVGTTLAQRLANSSFALQMRGMLAWTKRTRLLGLFSPILAACVAACGPETVPVSTSWSLGEPTFEVGGLSDDPRSALGDVVGGLRLDDGRVVIADRLAFGLKQYSPDGAFLKQVGGEGQGPGEFEYLRGIDRCDGGIAAFQINWGQNLYDEDLEFTGTRPAEIEAVGGGAYDFACNERGYALATGWGDFQSQFKAGYYVATAPVALLRRAELVHDFGERLSSERVGVLRPDGAPGGSGPHPFGRSMTVALGPDRAYLGDASDYLIEAYDLDGSRLPDIVWEGPDLTLSSADFDGLLERMIADAAPSDQADVRRRWRDLPRLERYPAYDTLLTDREGNLWVRLFPRIDAEALTWVVFSPEGARLGELRLPLRSTLLDAGPSWVLVSELDDYDVATVRVYDVIR